jgi:hypothetical protein
MNFSYTVLTCKFHVLYSEHKFDISGFRRILLYCVFERITCLPLKYNNVGYYIYVFEQLEKMVKPVMPSKGIKGAVSITIYGPIILLLCDLKFHIIAGLFHPSKTEI